MQTEQQMLRSAYEGVEADFPDEAARERYRSSMLERSRPQVDFLERVLPGGSVLEVGCGNGRLLIELARRGRITRGLGIDTARSRIDFARAWAKDLGLGSLRFEVQDALETRPGSAEFDAVLCITGAFAYFEPVRRGAAAALARQWAAALRPGGLLALELYPHPEVIRVLEATGGSARLWQELEPGDPWRFYLSELSMEQGTLSHQKTFIHRVTGEVDSGRHERLALYSDDELRELLTQAGLDTVSCHAGWTDRPYDGGEVMVVLSRR